MAQPPTLPSRPSQRASLIHTTIQPSEEGTQSTPPPQLPPRTGKPLGKLNARKTAQVDEPLELPLTDQNDDTTRVSSSGQPPRFIAPPLSTSSTPTSNPLQKILQPVLHLLALNPSDTPEEALARKELEEEQISRYMASFSRHVQYLRMDGGDDKPRAVTAQGELEKPVKETFRISRVSHAPVTEIATLATPKTVDDSISSENASSNPLVVVPDEAISEGTANDIDWFGYYAAVSNVHLITTREKRLTYPLTPYVFPVV